MQIITLGIGTPGTIPEFLTFGLVAGASTVRATEWITLLGGPQGATKIEVRR